MDQGSTPALSWEGLDETQRAMQRLAVMLLDLRPLWAKVSDLAIGWISSQFNTEGMFMLGQPWAPLSPRYAAWKALRYPGKPILSADGDLRRAATSPKREARPLSLTLTIQPYTKRAPFRSTDFTEGADGRSRRRKGTGKPRRMSPAWFQEGTPRMPARPLVWDLPSSARRELDAAGSDYADEIIRRAGLA